jgi:gamma-D-glutamyl-L-lysine dipeptidyl-peptidase
MPSLQIYKNAFVNVAVATVWRSPGSPRDIDQMTLGNPAQVEAWVNNMSHENKLDLLGRIDTQCLYGEKVLIKRLVQEWAYVEVLDQPGKKGAKSYPGWIPIQQLSANANLEAQEKNPYVVVTSPKANLHETEEGTEVFLEVSYNTQLPLKGETEKAFSVDTPDGLKWLTKTDGEILDGKFPSGERLIEEASLFLGLEYLWGGMSAWGFDCSGFAYSIHKRFGITIPRDADDQFFASTPISREDLRSGDLVFFAHDKGEGAIHHVGFYVGDGKLVHAPQTGKSVETLDLWSHDRFPDEFIGGCRFI